MSFFELIFSVKFLISLIIVFVFSVILSFIPVTGTLGFEYSFFSAFLLSFIIVFLSAEFSNEDEDSFVKLGITEKFSILLLIGFILLLLNFIIGLISSLIRKDCFVGNGFKLYLLLPVFSVLFSTSLGLFTGSTFKKRGFFIGALILICSIIISLIEFYYRPHIFMYNPVFGYFPGPFYDRIITVESPLIIYRLRILFWSFFLLSVLIFKSNSTSGRISLSNVLVLVVVLISLLFLYIKQQDFGITTTRNYITSKYLTGKYETENFIIFYKPGSRNEMEIELIANDHEWRYKQLSEYLEIYKRNKITSYLYPDQEMRKRLVGSYKTTFADPVNKEIHIVYDSFPLDVLKHELVHVMSSEFGTNILKVSPKVGLIEGLAVAADWPADGYTKHQWAKSLFAMNKIDISRFNEMFGIRFWYEPASVAYTVMGSFCRFLIDEYGIDRFKIFYKTGNTDIYNSTINQLLVSWKNYLEEFPLPEHSKVMSNYRFSDKGVFKDVCPRKTAYFVDEGIKSFKDKNFVDAKEYLKKAYELNSSNPLTKIYLAYAYYYNRDYQELKELTIQNETISSVENNVLKNLTANATWHKYGYYRAYSMFYKLSKSPLIFDIELLLDIKINLRNYSKSIRSVMEEYILTTDDVKKVGILEEMIYAYPGYSPAYYLLGKIFLKIGDYSRASSYFKGAELKGLPSEKLRLHNLMMLGISQFASGMIDDSHSTFNKLIFLDINEKYTYIADDFKYRIKWVRNN